MELAGDSPEQLQHRWSELTADGPAEAPLAERFARATREAAGAFSAESAEDARETLVELEVLAGLESPVEDAELRRNLQVERLSSRMRGTQSLGAAEQLDALLGRWSALGATATANEPRFERALLAAIESLR